MKALTPAMRQYVEIKDQYKDCILFFRMGDFYEMFFEDAVTASKVLEITLTSRNKGKEDSIPLCGIPYHAASSYIAKLIDKGYKVAVCEQVEDPKQAKGIVRREVVRVITPGLVIDPDTLHAKEHNLLAALSVRDDMHGLAFVDISTGEFWVAESGDRDYLRGEIGGLDFREFLVSESLRERAFVRMLAQESPDCVVNSVPPDYFDVDEAMILLRESFSDDVLGTVAFSEHEAMVSAAGAVLRYIGETRKEKIHHLTTIRWHKADDYLLMDNNAKRNLELFGTIQEGKKVGSLIHVVDMTSTAMGGRRLRWWLNYPLVEPEKIKERLAAVSELKENPLLRGDLQQLLSRVYDLERLGSRVAMEAANARDMVALKDSLTVVPDIIHSLSTMESPLITTIRDGLDPLAHVVDVIDHAIVPDPPLTIREGNIIREGYDEELDRLISASRDGKKWIAALEAKERKRTGITTLKVGYNSVFGYYIEVTKANTDLVPDDYIRKQTLVNAERYINQELKEYEYTVLNAEDKRKEREYNLYGDIRRGIGRDVRSMHRTASLLADLDVLVSLAEVAEKYNYCRPLVDDGNTIDIKGGRHPVVERMDMADGYVPNDVFLNDDTHRLLVITGPNMAGKSTYIRQVALIVLMAQMGGFVPASEARIGVVDRIFTRVGAADSLARGQSTFMVEMTEVATILHNATSKSLILLDEVGRGTSTFDGLSIAWAVAEHINNPDLLGGRTLFATHYHELTDMAREYGGIKNYSIAVKEWGDRVIFLRNIVEGGTNRSYGIQVARLAGVPEEVVGRAREILENLEGGELDEVGRPTIAKKKKADKRSGQLSLFMSADEQIIGELKAADVGLMTPLEALNKINEWRNRLGKKE
ncbi:MAG: DNA mismatch repair protein MutS [Deltaproteobacteria bacterium]|nr:DNA mismatch repair protein MutS [Deltaproteobacteria bacterium]